MAQRYLPLSGFGQHALSHGPPTFHLDRAGGVLQSAADLGVGWAGGREAELEAGEEEVTVGVELPLLG